MSSLIMSIFVNWRCDGNSGNRASTAINYLSVSQDIRATLRMGRCDAAGKNVDAMFQLREGLLKQYNHCNLLTRTSHRVSSHFAPSPSSIRLCIHLPLCEILTRRRVPTMLLVPAYPHHLLCRRPLTVGADFVDLDASDLLDVCQLLDALDDDRSMFDGGPRCLIMVRTDDVDPEFAAS